MMENEAKDEVLVELLSLTSNFPPQVPPPLINLMVDKAIIYYLRDHEPEAGYDLIKILQLIAHLLYKTDPQQEWPGIAQLEKIIIELEND
jgi:hypothetical protein